MPAKAPTKNPITTSAMADPASSTVVPVVSISKNIRIPAIASTATNNMVSTRFGNTANKRAPIKAPPTDPMVNHSVIDQSI